jgi:hypothetical protein
VTRPAQPFTLLSLAAAGLFVTVATLLGEADSALRRHRTRPMIVLEHGACADTSRRDDAVQCLERASHPVMVAAPLCSPANDVAYLCSLDARRRLHQAGQAPRAASDVLMAGSVH